MDQANLFPELEAYNLLRALLVGRQPFDGDSPAQALTTGVLVPDADRAAAAGRQLSQSAELFGRRFGALAASRLRTEVSGLAAEARGAALLALAVELAHWGRADSAAGSMVEGSGGVQPASGDPGPCERRVLMVAMTRWRPTASAAELRVARARDLELLWGIVDRCRSIAERRGVGSSMTLGEADKVLQGSVDLSADCLAYGSYLRAESEAIDAVCERISNQEAAVVGSKSSEGAAQISDLYKRARALTRLSALIRQRSAEEEGIPLARRLLFVIRYKLQQLVPATWLWGSDGAALVAAAEVTPRVPSGSYLLRRALKNFGRNPRISVFRYVLLHLNDIKRQMH